MLMHNLQGPAIFLYSEREIIIMHVHSRGHIISGCKARQRHQAQHRDGVRRDGVPGALFSCAKPCGCGLGLEEISPALFSPLSSAVLLGALAAATDLHLNAGMSSLSLLASSMCWVPLSSPLPVVLWAADTSLVLAAADRNQVYLPYSNTLNVFSSPFPEFGPGPRGQNELEFICKITLTNSGPLPVLLLGKSFMSPKARCPCLLEAAICSFSKQVCKEAEQEKIVFL